jgi:hypothetical protein
MVFPCALGRWSRWLVPSETIPMAHEVMGDVVSPDAITMTAPAGRKYVALACCKQWTLAPLHRQSSLRPRRPHYFIGTVR